MLGKKGSLDVLHRNTEPEIKLNVQTVLPNGIQERQFGKNARIACVEALADLQKVAIFGNKASIRASSPNLNRNR